MKQWNMAEQLKKYKSKLEFVIGDIRDMQRLDMATKGVDYIIHSAATKIVPTAEDNPFECIKTNINGAMNVIDESLDAGVSRVVALSTDKACSPINLYGATKLASDKLFVAANSYGGVGGTRFSVVRYGNVMGSRGSVIPLFQSFANSQTPLLITHPDMTRFMIDLSDAVSLVWHTFSDMVGGEIYVRRTPSMKVTDIALAVAPKIDQEVIGTRPGEKLHEMMINSEDADYTYEYENYFKILPGLYGWHADIDRIKDGKRVPSGFDYRSDRNNEWMTVKTLQAWFEQNKNLIGKL